MSLCQKESRSTASVVWSVVEDELKTPHEGILIQIGEKEKSVRHEVIDWKHFDWDGYKAASRVELADLKEKWNQDVELDCDSMLQSLTDSIQTCVDKVATVKIITSRSKPWVNREVSEQLKKLMKQRKRCPLRKSRLNIAEYEKIRKKLLTWLRKLRTNGGFLNVRNCKMQGRKTRRPASADRTARAANFRRDLEAT